MIGLLFLIMTVALGGLVYTAYKFLTTTKIVEKIDNNIVINNPFIFLVVVFANLLALEIWIITLIFL
jgi:hypothetical protein